MRRPRWPVLAAIAAAVPVAAVVLAAAAFRLYPQPVLERAASWIGGRPVHVATARFSGAATLEVEGLTMAAAEDDDRPELLRIDRLVAALRPWALLRGAVMLDRLDIDGMHLALRHNGDRRPNWRRILRGDEPPPAARPFLPTILAMQLHDCGLTLRTSSGAELRIDGHEVTLAAAGPDQPIGLQGRFSYNDAPIELSAKLGSFDDYRDTARRFPLALEASSGPSHASLSGSADQPLAFDALEGALRLETADLGAFASIFGNDLHLKVAAGLSAKLTRNGDAWRLVDTAGTLAGGGFTGELALDEGAHGQPDRLRTELAFSELELDALLRGHEPGGGGAIVVEARPGTLLDARLSAARLVWRGAGATGLRLAARIAPGRMALDDIALTLGDGQMTGQVSGELPGGAESAAPVLAARLQAEGAETGALLQLAGVRTRLLTGRARLHAQVSATGTTLAQARRNAVGQAVLSMGQGQVSREIMSLAATDLRRLFGPASGFTRISCLLAVLDVREGFAVLTPFRVRSAEGTLFGGGVIDLGRDSLDLTFKTQGSSTGFFALDVPMRLTGPVADPSIRPVIESDAVAIANQGVVVASRLPEPMRNLAQASGCVR